nr:MAG TPA: hypothetical protein [Caudoviricetes sp.]
MRLRSISVNNKKREPIGLPIFFSKIFGKIFGKSVKSSMDDFHILMKGQRKYFF